MTPLVVILLRFIVCFKKLIYELSIMMLPKGDFDSFDHSASPLVCARFFDDGDERRFWCGFAASAALTPVPIW
jgi:hypothetical protein